MKQTFFARKILSVFLLSNYLAGCASAPASITPAISTLASSSSTPTPTAAPSLAPTLPILPTVTTELSTATQSPTPWVGLQADQPISFIKGLDMISWSSSPYSGKLTDESLAALKETGAEWVGIEINLTQSKHGSTFMFKAQDRTINDVTLAHMIKEAHALGLRVLLRPFVDLTDDPGFDTDSVGLGFNEAQWKTWFINYTYFMLDYARLAEDNGVDMFSLGSELLATQQRKNEWTRLANDVRKVYHGPITYQALWDYRSATPITYQAQWDDRLAAPMDSFYLSWWDAVDYISVSFYFKLINKVDPTLQDLEAGWARYIKAFQQLSQKYGKQVIFMEIGYPATSRAIENPGEIYGTLDTNIQARAYQVAFNRLVGQSWLKGMFWFDWEDNVYQGGLCDPRPTPKGKPAENVLRQAFGAPLVQLNNQPPVLPAFSPDHIVSYDLYSAPATQLFNPDASWNVTFSESSIPAYQNQKSLNVKFHPGGAIVAPMKALDTSPYQWLEFYINPSESNPRLNLKIEEVGGMTFEHTYYIDTCLCAEGGKIEANQWTRVLVPLDHFDADKRKLAFLALSMNVEFIDHPIVMSFSNIRLVGLK